MGFGSDSDYDDIWKSGGLADIFKKKNRTAYPSYDDEEVDQTGNLKRKLAKMEDMAKRIMEALDADGRADFVLLKDPEICKWWRDIKEEEKRIQAELERKQKAKEEKERLARLKTDLLNRLTPDEKKALGIKD